MVPPASTDPATTAPSPGDDDGPRRHHVADAVFNLRDLGGYVTADGRTTRWGRLFRADGLHRTTPAGGAVVRGLGIAAVIDLRTPGERDKEGVFGHPDITGLHLPLIDRLWDMKELLDGAEADFLLAGYREMTTQHGDRIAAVLTEIGRRAGTPLVFHCTAGKDRTGVIAALVLALLGVDDDTITADFALSEPAARRMAEWYLRNRTAESAERAERLGLDPAKAMRLISARPETMAGLLAELRQRHGSIDAYVDALGVSATTVDELRAHLLH